MMVLELPFCIETAAGSVPVQLWMFHNASARDRLSSHGLPLEAQNEGCM
jgi:hypothetical protein